MNFAKCAFDQYDLSFQ